MGARKRKYLGWKIFFIIGIIAFSIGAVFHLYEYIQGDISLLKCIWLTLSALCSIYLGYIGLRGINRKHKNNEPLL